MSVSVAHPSAGLLLDVSAVSEFLYPTIDNKENKIYSKNKSLRLLGYTAVLSALPFGTACLHADKRRGFTEAGL